MQINEILNQKLFNMMSPKSRGFFWGPNDRRALIVIISLLGAWIVCFPYEGQLLYSLARNYGIEGEGMLDISLIMLIIGLISGGIFIKTIKAARQFIIYTIPVCLLCTITFFFPIYSVWMIALTICSVIAGISIAASGYFINNFVQSDSRFRTTAEIIIIINILKMLINNISLYVSIQTGFAFTIIMLGVLWYLTFKMPYLQYKTVTVREFNKKTGSKALILLFLFIAVFSIDFVIMTDTVNPQYKSPGWLTNSYWLLPYLVAAFIMRRLKNTDNRTNLLYAAVGMIGFGFILSVILDHSIYSFLIINAVMMAAWAVSDIFWWSILFEMLEMVKRSSVIFSVGFNAIMIGILLGKIIVDNDPTIFRGGLSEVTMAVICITLVILPILHRLLSMMIKKNEKALLTETESMSFSDLIGTLTEREKQIAALLLKGRTCKLIAAELYLSENTVKTHIKNIYSKLGIKRKSELFNFTIEQTVDN